MLLGYNTNGFAHHRLEDALTIIAELGYKSVAITLDYHSLNPFADDCEKQVAAIGKLLRKFLMRSVVETGARFLLDPRHKHQPTLVSKWPRARERRLDFLRRAALIAEALRSDAVSFWSGADIDGAQDEVVWNRLTSGCLELCHFAEQHNVLLAFEPEPGMFVPTMDRFAELHDRVKHRNFGLTLDVGHLHCMNEVPIAPHIERWKDKLWNVHIEDMRRGVHDHLMFGEGEMDFGEVLGSLRKVGYQGGVHVELSRHSHDAVETARKAMGFLRGAMRAAPRRR